ncbi:hypothetical protein SERLADRAFT_478403 [Serpula lacrymans var. lacrymans S7.9]|uniref:Uncharacterized protein n=1 Tax=Serpula lacrymans var. lacrymans (strain S7.9) TaxID=578457 RepID=F8PAS7_SERL9|nr:uncharacterized protein SERLADRAFT_478403 [Serpula lacrymans var. lacrymans S7.9]EGO19915.1 hypothetical protein SERLADRAFT_478403 [Serpula lacrymans var. lacrymans S7.9]
MNGGTDRRMLMGVAGVLVAGGLGRQGREWNATPIQGWLEKWGTDRERMRIECWMLGVFAGSEDDGGVMLKSNGTGCKDETGMGWDGDKDGDSDSERV